MTLEELHNQPKYVRVLAISHWDEPQYKAMIGGEYEVITEYHDDDTIVLQNVSEDVGLSFNRSDVQFLTPIEFNGKKIGIGDGVFRSAEWYIVYGYIWQNNGWWVGVSRDEQLKQTFWVHPTEIGNHRPLETTNPAKLKWQQEMERLKEEGRKNGWE